MMVRESSGARLQLDELIKIQEEEMLRGLQVPRPKLVLYDERCCALSMRVLRTYVVFFLRGFMHPCLCD